MRAVIWKGHREIDVADVPEPRIEHPTDAVIRVCSTAICGSDLHLYNVLDPYMHPGDVLGHEAMGVVEATGSQVGHLRPGERVVVPFNIACGRCWMCEHDLMSQCETTRADGHDTGGAIFGYGEPYGSVPGAQAERLRVPQAHFGLVKLPPEAPDERWLFLSDVLPTAWQAVRYADVEPGSSCLVMGLGAVGQLCVRVAKHLGAEQVVGVDTVHERCDLAREWGAEIIESDQIEEVVARARELTEGRGPDSVIDAVGMEAHGSPLREWLQQRADLFPDSETGPVAESVRVDRLDALATAIDAVRRGGTVSVAGVYAGKADPVPMAELFDKNLTIRMGQCNVKRWIPQIWPTLAGPEDKLGVESLATHKLPLEEAKRGYELFDAKRDGCLKVVLQP